MTNPKVTLSAGTSPIEGAVGTYLITLDTPAPVGGLTVYYNTTGSTATLNDDYNFKGGDNLRAVTDNSFTVIAGATTATLDLVAHSDGVIDPKEKVVVNLVAAVGYDLVNTNTQFSLQTTVPVGRAPLSVTTADFNGDGNVDLATANSDDNTVSVRLGNGKGGFTGNTTIAVGSWPWSVTSADFNNDGNADLAIANARDNTVSVRLGNGKGDFTGKTTVPVDESPFSVTTADFNNDGNADLASGGSSNSSNGTVSVHLGDGSGGFTGNTSVAVYGQSPSVIIADFNNDGNADLAVANFYNISIHLGNGRGGFTGNTTVAVGDYPFSLTTADFNNDGNADLAVTNIFNDTVSVRLGNGNGRFTGNTSFKVDKYSKPDTVISADFNNDGNADLATGGQRSNNISIHLGNGRGGFTGNTFVAVDGYTHSVTTADFNNDGNADLATASSTGRTVSILLNTFITRSLSENRNEKLFSPNTISFNFDTEPEKLPLFSINNQYKTICYDIMTTNNIT